MNRLGLPSATLAAALLLHAGSAPAAPVAAADVEATLGMTTTTSADPGPVSALAELVDVDRGEWATRGASNANGNIGVRSEFFGAQGQFATLGSRATWSDSVDAAAGSTISFDFTIPEAAIGFQANNVPGLSGGFLVEVLFNGAPVFMTRADVQTLSSFPSVEADYDLVQAGTALSATFSTGVAPGLGVGGSGFHFAALSQSLSLAAVAGINTIEYSMSAFVDGLIGETSALAVIGDPLNLSQSGPGVALTVVPGGGGMPLPEPAAALLLLAGLAAVRRRRRA